MPLLAPTLINSLRSFMDPDFSGFSGFPTESTAPQLWTDAFQSYILLIVNPPAGAGTMAGHSAGATAMKVALSGMAAPGVAASILPAAFAAYAAAFASTTAPFVSIPPPAPFVLPFEPTTIGEEAATIIGTAIHLWTITGVSSIPPATPVVWS